MNLFVWRILLIIQSRHWIFVLNFYFKQLNKTMRSIYIWLILWPSCKYTQTPTYCNDLVEKIIPKPTVCGLLCQGENLNTCVMDMPSSHIHRMVKLSKVTLCRNIEELQLLTIFISKLIQIKVRTKFLIKTFISC